MAVGGAFSSGNSNANLYVYSFDRLNNSITQVAVAGNSVLPAQSVNWSFDGRYIAVGEDNTNIDHTIPALHIYSFDRVVQSLTFITAEHLGNPTELNTISSVNWSPNGEYLAAGGNTSNISKGLYLFSFNTASGTLTQLEGTGIGAAHEIFTVKWSPDGQYLAVGGFVIAGGGNVHIYRFDPSLQTLLIPVTATRVGSLLAIS